MEDILEAAGLTRSTLYYHYKGKADIFVASMLTMMEAMRRASEAIIARQDLTVEARIRLLLRAKREKEEEVAAGHEDEFSLSEKMIEEAMRHLAPTQRAQIAQAMEAVHLLMQRLMAEGIARGEFRPFSPELLDYAFWQMFTQASRLPRGTALSRAEQEEQLLDMFFGGVRAG
jgi:AcrR family transcriptional regulator